MQVLLLVVGLVVAGVAGALLLRRRAQDQAVAAAARRFELSTEEAALLRELAAGVGQRGAGELPNSLDAFNAAVARWTIARAEAGGPARAVDLSHLAALRRKVHPASAMLERPKSTRALIVGLDLRLDAQGDVVQGRVCGIDDTGVGLELERAGLDGLPVSGDVVAELLLPERGRLRFQTRVIRREAGPPVRVWLEHGDVSTLEDRRAFLRVFTDARVSVRRGSDEHPALMRDLSANGVAFFADAGLRPGDRVAVSLPAGALTDGPQALQCEVLRVEADGARRARVHAAWVELDAATREALVRYVLQLHGERLKV